MGGWSGREQEKEVGVNSLGLFGAPPFLQVCPEQTLLPPTLELAVHVFFPGPPIPVASLLPGSAPLFLPSSLTPAL